MRTVTDVTHQSMEMQTVQLGRWLQLRQVTNPPILVLYLLRPEVANIFHIFQVFKFDLNFFSKFSGVRWTLRSPFGGGGQQ